MINIRPITTLFFIFVFVLLSKLELGPCHLKPKSVVQGFSVAAPLTFWSCKSVPGGAALGIIGCLAAALISAPEMQ
jgi:hypothetical protein